MVEALKYIILNGFIKLPYNPQEQMKDILDEKMNQSDLVKEDLKLRRAKTKIMELESNEHYGFYLLILSMAILLFNVVGLFIMEETVPLIILLINVLFIGVYGILLYFSKEDKLIAYTGGLLVFIFAGILHLLLGQGPAFSRPLWLILVLGSYAIVVYEQIKLWSLRNQLRE